MLVSGSLFEKMATLILTAASKTYTEGKVLASVASREDARHLHKLRVQHAVYMQTAPDRFSRLFRTSCATLCTLILYAQRKGPKLGVPLT